MKKMRIIPLTTAAVLASVAGVLTMNAKTFTETDINEFAKSEAVEGAYENVYIIGTHIFKQGIDLNKIMTASRTLGADEPNIIYRRANDGTWTNAMNGQAVAKPKSFELTHGNLIPFEEDSEVAKALAAKQLEAEALDAEKYTSTSYAELVKALNLPATNDAERQTKINAIDKAMDALEFSNLKTLNDLYAKYAKLVADDYALGAYTEFKNSLAKLKEDMPETTYEEIEEKITAVKALESILTTGNATEAKAALGSAIDAEYTTGRVALKITNKDSNDNPIYTEESYTAYTKALKDAIAVEKSSNALISEITAATKAIETTKNALIPLNKATLEELVSTVKGLSRNTYYFGLNDAEEIDYTVWNNLQDLVKDKSEATNNAYAALNPANKVYNVTDIQNSIDAINSELNKLITESTYRAYEAKLVEAKTKLYTKDNDGNFTDTLIQAVDCAEGVCEFDKDSMAYLKAVSELEYDGSAFKYVDVADNTAKNYTDEDGNTIDSYEERAELLIEFINDAINGNSEKKISGIVFYDQKKLDAKLEEIKDLKEIDYTAGTWADLQAAIKKADAVEVSANKDVKYKYDILNEAVSHLNEITEVDITALKEKYNAQFVEKDGKVTTTYVIDATKYSSASWLNYTTEVTKAKAIITAVEADAKNHGKLQSEINAAVENINKAIEALLTKETGAKLDAAMTLEENAADLYKNDDAFKAYNKLVADNSKAPANETAALELISKLETAKAELTAKNNSDLNDALETIKDLVQSQYTENTWANLQEAVNDAKALNGHGSHSANEDAIDAIETARDAMIYSNAEALKIALNIMSTVDETKFAASAYTKLNEIVDDANDTYQVAADGKVTNKKDSNAVVTYTQIQTAINDINKAYKELIDTPENADKLTQVKELAESTLNSADIKKHDNYNEFVEAYNKAIKLSEGTQTLNANKIDALTQALLIVDVTVPTV